MSVKICGECGFPHGPRGLCIAKEEAKKQVGYRPGFRETLSTAPKREAMPLQMGPQR